MENIYCDESCHLEYDHAKAMLLSAISCPSTEKERICTEIRNIKLKHKLSTWTEIKWTGVSPSKYPFYEDLIQYFINEDALHFRVVIMKDKANLNHDKYNGGSHDLWYYKAYYYLLNELIHPHDEFNIFIDIKDTCGGPKVSKLKEILCNKNHDFRGQVIKGIYQIRSHESEILEMDDLLMGAIGYYHNEHYGADHSSQAKNAVVNLLLDKYGNAVRYGTGRGENAKMDIFLWRLTR